MAPMNLAATPVAVSSPPRGSVNHATAAHRHSTWQRTLLDAVGTFLILAGIAVGILAHVLILLGLGRWKQLTPLSGVLAVLFLLHFLFRPA